MELLGMMLTGRTCRRTSMEIVDTVMRRKREEGRGGGGEEGDGLRAVQMQYSFPSVISELPTVVI